MERTLDGRVLVVSRDAEEIARLIRASTTLEVVARTPSEVRETDGAGVRFLVAFQLPQSIEFDQLEFIQSTGAGVDGILSAGDRLPIRAPIGRIVEEFGEEMGEYVLARVFAIAQGMPRLAISQRERRWEPFVPRRIAELRIVVVGMGAIGQEIAVRLAEAGATVMGVQRSPSSDALGVIPTYSIDSLDRLLPDADVVVLVAPRTPQTDSLIDARRLALMKRDGWIINVGRGAVIDEIALIDALDGGRIGGAALDVFVDEPLPPSSRLWESDRVLISPHIAGITRPDQVARAFLENHRRWSMGVALRGEVDRVRGY